MDDIHELDENTDEKNWSSQLSDDPKEEDTDLEEYSLISKNEA